MLEKKPTRRTRSVGLAWLPLYAIFILIAAGDRSQAQYGIGFGLNLGFENPKTETNFLNSWSLQNGVDAANNRPTNLTAPRFQTRDDGYLERYDLATRQAMVNRVARNPASELRRINRTSGRTPSTAQRSNRTTTPSPAPAPAVAEQPKRAMLLATFFDEDGKLIWPADAPVTSDLSAKRRVADQAILAVLNEYQLKGLAQLSNVTNARERLLDYGRPALDFARRQLTPAVAESFHSFLLSLYDNVGLAATVPRTP